MHILYTLHYKFIVEKEKTIVLYFNWLKEKNAVNFFFVYLNFHSSIKKNVLVKEIILFVSRHQLLNVQEITEKIKFQVSNPFNTFSSSPLLPF